MKCSYSGSTASFADNLFPLKKLDIDLRLLLLKLLIRPRLSPNPFFESVAIR